MLYDDATLDIWSVQAIVFIWRVFRDALTFVKGLFLILKRFFKGILIEVNKGEFLKNVAQSLAETIFMCSSLLPLSASTWPEPKTMGERQSSPASKRKRRCALPLGQGEFAGRPRPGEGTKQIQR